MVGNPNVVCQSLVELGVYALQTNSGVKLGEAQVGWSPLKEHHDSGWDM